ncbi:ATP-binding protein [Phytohabitans aurantiacus]|uniref:ATPase AAA n=1 Tax=Phytohabitans aurantiacus TaxID=3016789 RepID=A0ABQ5QLC5_9ACTN|nr:ATP-binding protein [Phytohabitans aurantiacus]GLH95103.1 ATPase AAA [Phytohabitans aurantiacus]
MKGHVRDALDAILAGSTAAAQESEILDFKQESDRGDGETLRVLVDATLCLANNRGGVVVLGVADRVPGVAAFLGTALAADAARLKIHSSTRPPLLVDVRVEFVQGQRLLLLDIPEGGEIYSDAKGRAPRRIGTDCFGMSPEEQLRLREDRSGVDWSAKPVADLYDVSAAAMAAARRRLDASLNPARRALARLSDEDLLRALGLVTRDGTLLRAGLVFVGTTGTSATYQYRESPGGEPIAIERLTGPLLTVYERVMDLITLRRRLTPLTLPDGQQLQVEDFPELAVREALTNALIHRDYHLADPVTIEHSPQVLAISSPGPLVAGVSVDNLLTHPSKPRNRALTVAARTVELAEEVGRGIDRMYREMVRSGRPTPTIEASYERVRVALVGTAPNLNIARYVAQLPGFVRDDTDAMIVLIKLCQVRTVTADVMAPLLQKGVDETEASLRHLASEAVAMIEPTRQTARAAHPYYRLREEALKHLGPAVPYARHKADEIERRVVAHVREYERITNATVQNLFTVSMHRARQILADLVSREILIKTSSAQRGPSVEYGPGARFPALQTRRARTRRSPDNPGTLPGL